MASYCPVHNHVNDSDLLAFFHRELINLYHKEITKHNPSLLSKFAIFKKKWKFMHYQDFKAVLK